MISVRAPAGMSIRLACRNPDCHDHAAFHAKVVDEKVILECERCGGMIAILGATIVQERSLNPDGSHEILSQSMIR